MDEYVLIFTVVFLCYWYWKYLKSSKNLPPGPLGLPFIGYVPFIKSKQNLTFASLKNKYGDIYSLQFGKKLVVMLSSYDTIKEAFVRQSQNFTARPVVMTAAPPEYTEVMGLIFNNDKPWIDNKQMVVANIKVFTRSTGIGESVVVNEINYLLQAIKNHNGKPAIIDQVVFKSVANVVWLFIFGERKDYDDKDFTMALNASHLYVRSFKFSGGDVAFPWIFRLKLVQKLLGITRGYDAFRQLFKFFGDKIDKMEAMPMSESDEPNFVHEWLKIYPKSSPQFDYYRNQLIWIIIDLFLAGSDTTTLTVQWAILYMMKYPEIQQKVQNEIDEVIGKSEPSMTYKNKMPYTEATIMEINRIISLSPIGGPHTNSEAAVVNGYTIPKESVLFANLWAIHHDPKVFPNPDEFQPERFLENGRLKKVDELMPFSIGKRQCLGELIARMEMFLYFTSLLQHFTFKKPEGATLSFDYDYAQVLTPRSQNVCAIERA